MPISTAALNRYADALSLGSVSAARQALARALATNFASQEKQVVFTVREGTFPSLALFGFFDDAAMDLLERQIRFLESACHNLDYWSYQRVEHACEVLAARLVEELGRSELAGARFAAIPRGGFVILTLVSSILSLKPEQLQLDGTPEPDNQLLVVLDDCALSGLRFKQFLDSNPSRRVVFATLCSTPELRAAVRAREPRVLSCVSANDLGKLSGGLLPDDRERCTTRVLQGDCYWLGATEPLGFPWNEPTRLLWEPAAERWVRAWRIVPPELCLKNRTAPVDHLIQWQPAARGPLRPSSQTLFAEIGQEVFVCSLRDGRVFRLGDTGSILWRGIVTGGDLEAAVEAAAGELDAPDSVLRADAKRFVEDLLARRLLTGACE